MYERTNTAIRQFSVNKLPTASSTKCFAKLILVLSLLRHLFLLKWIRFTCASENAINIHDNLSHIFSFHHQIVFKLPFWTYLIWTEFLANKVASLSNVQPNSKSLAGQSSNLNCHLSQWMTVKTWYDICGKTTSIHFPRDQSMRFFLVKRVA